MLSSLAVIIQYLNFFSIENFDLPNCVSVVILAILIVVATFAAYNFIMPQKGEL